MVEIRVEFVNRGHESVDLVFNSSLVSAFSVYDSSGALVCAIPQIALWWLVHEILEPGETLVGGCDWHQIDDEGSQVPHPGLYTIVADALCLERDLSARTTVFVMD